MFSLSVSVFFSVGTLPSGCFPYLVTPSLSLFLQCGGCRERVPVCLLVGARGLYLGASLPILEAP